MSPTRSTRSSGTALTPRARPEGPVDIDNLSGRDLDAVVAEHVFGLQIKPGVNVRTSEKDFLYALPSGDWVRVAYYSGSMSASLTVEVEMKKRGWTRKEWLGVDHWDAPGNVRVTLEHSDGRSVQAVGSLNEAICRAALKALAI